MSEDPFSSPGSEVLSANFKKRKSRFTFSEVQLLLTEVKRNRHILVGKFNQGVSSDVKKRTWAALAASINEISECHREVIEIVKKWSDLKCDTKRKVAAMRASGFSAARITDDLSPIEKMVHQILQPGPGEKFPLSDSIADEDEDSQGASWMPLHIPGTANGRLSIKAQGMPHHSGMSSKGDADLPLDMPYNYYSAVPLTDLEYEPSGTEDQGLRVTEAEYQTSQGAGSLQEHLAKSASLSLQEQQAATVLIGALSRSLESVAESVQQLVQTQQEFARDTLRLQRDTLHVLRDFSSTALALMQDKSNGHP
ncbi:nuclear apoptosis-inducing factor 1 isoform X2 [Ictalurus furcatus]|uniref:nuclear apoptosis-inducing factor 1 isoform X2 n=1 Tax=Ictalurus furcatus TaxID=66913 RepID=UPI0023506D66|nr:nuclear apoptosis-inducing factor 1 isoform X2 [Ictalurus furcatus]